MNGILLVDKPAGFTSHDVVAKLRGILRERRIGHSGTLDPMATGLLVVFVGRATRAVEFAENDGKEYIASMRLGVETDTQDMSGNVLRERDMSVTDGEITAALKSLLGDSLQIPPMYSAIKIGGKKLYEIARSGGEVERTPRRIKISEIEFMRREGAECSFRVFCSKGTYVRTICADAGEKLGCGAALSALRRTKAGDFSVDNAFSLQQISALAAEGRAGEALLPLNSLFTGYTGLVIDEGAERRCRCGTEFHCPSPDGIYTVYSSDGAFLMLGRCEAGVMKTVKSFFEV